MKSPVQLTAAIERRLARSWHLDVSGADASWPHTLALGRVTSAEIAGSFAAVQGQIGELRSWAATHGLEVRDESRNVAGTTQLVPSHVVVPDIDTAVAIAGRQWVRRVADGRRRSALLATAHGPNAAIPSVVRAFAGASDIDVELLSTAST